MNANPVKDKTRETLRSSFSDGVFASGMMGFTQDYFTPFLLLLKATILHVSMLTALPNLFASLVQLKGADLSEILKSRKRVINTFVMLQAVTLLPMTAMAFFGVIKPVLFIAFVILFTSFGALALPAWGSFMSDLIPENKRGDYFGWRNRVLGFILVGAAFVAGFILTVMKRVNIFYGFAVIFGLAFAFRVISWYFLEKMHEPPLKYGKEHYFTFFKFIANMRRSNFAKFTLFVSMMNFSVNLAAPFFAVLMLQDLHFSYLLYTLITVTATFMVYFTISRWGRHADKVGNLKIIKFTSFLVGFIPLLWVINRNPLFLFAAQVFSGFLWAGFNLCTSNFIYDAVTAEKRVRCISYFNFMNGLGICGGAVCGGFLLRYLPPLFGYKILSLFLISAALRMTVGICMSMKLKEVRPVEHVNHAKLFFSILGIEPIL